MDTNNGVSIDRRTGLEELDRQECLKLLARAPLGRLGVVVGGRPVVFPVNFTLDGAAVVLRTDEGTKLYAARNGPVAFECDGIDRIYHTGWSVLVLGDAEEVHDPHEIARLGRLPLSGWSPGPKPKWLRIRGTITGRRIPSHRRMQTEEDVRCP
jgi:nitroimidazol reductase NimA-like FMN-containing flavoprotein (pyridoxamine 5'-phosphate oxidase superfamily)